jgi:hypothetical protein
MNRDELSAKIIAGASIHRVAVRIIEDVKRSTATWYKPIAAAKLAFFFKLSFPDAWSVIQEMDLTPHR